MVIIDQAVLGIEIQHPHPFHRQMRHIDGEVIDQRLPGSQHRPLDNLTPRHPPGGDGNRFQRSGAGFAHALDALQGLRIGVKHTGKATELCDQCLGNRLGIALLYRCKQQVFEHFIIGQRFRPACQQPGAKAGAVAFPCGFARVRAGRSLPPEIETLVSIRQCAPPKIPACACLIAFGR
jgi:hypothetical protein